MTRVGDITVSGNVVGNIDVAIYEDERVQQSLPDTFFGLGIGGHGSEGDDHLPAFRHGVGPGSHYHPSRRRGPTFRRGVGPGSALRPTRPEKPEHFTLDDIHAAVSGEVKKLSAAGPVKSADLYHAAVQRFRNSSLKGFVPRDGARFGIKTGAPEEWARLAVALAKQESSLNPNAPNGGLYQFKADDLRRYGVQGDVNDPNAQLEAAARQWERYIGESGAIAERGGGPGSYGGYRGAAAYFEPFRYPETQLFKHMGEADRVSRGEAFPPDAGPPSNIGVGAETAVGGGPPAAFIMHHTGGGGTVEGVQNTLRQRGLGVQYIMDRDGKIHHVGGPGSAHMMTGWGMGEGLSNRNVVGMEVIARDDRDVTPAQVESAKRFIAQNYPGTPVFGHGQVNPGHKEAEEGMTIVRAIQAERAVGGGRAAPVGMSRYEHPGMKVHSVEQIKRDLDSAIKRGD